MYGKQCPVDGTPMQTVDFNGVAIEQCGTCRGTWFDGGELTTAIARISSMPGYNPNGFLERHHGGHVAHGHHRDSSDHHGHGHQRKQESWIGDLFD